MRGEERPSAGGERGVLLLPVPHKQIMCGAQLLLDFTYSSSQPAGAHMKPLGMYSMTQSLQRQR